MNYTVNRFHKGKTIGKPVDKGNVSKFLPWRNRVVYRSLQNSDACEKQDGSTGGFHGLINPF